ncbi:flagellar biosynthesis protein FlhB [Bdellovibrionota bacterium FG-1]
MAEDQKEDRSRDDLSEDASPYRLEEMRRKGQVSQSRELTGLIALMAAAAVTYVMSPKMGADLAEFMRETFRTDLSARLDLGGAHVLGGVFSKALRLTAILAFPICLAGFIFGIIGSLAQVGSIFSTDPITPDLSKIDPFSGLKRLVSRRTAIDGLRLIFKMITVLLVAYSLVKTEIVNAPLQMAADPVNLFNSYGHAAKVIFLSLMGVLTVFAIIDWFLTKREYDTSLRLTKQEAKQEHKEREGDPQIKARIRAVQREMARRRMMQAVKKADVIITNPTHIAIALVYERNSMAAPKVVAKGADFLAQKIKKIAADAGIPMVENVPLARTLYKTVKVNQFVPRALYQAVAEVLAYVYRLKNRGL